VSLGERCFCFYHGPWSAHRRAGDQLCGKKGERVQWWFLSEVIECGFDALWLGWWKKWATVRDLELHGLGERRGW
jgi:hypothetical protein